MKQARFGAETALDCPFANCFERLTGIERRLPFERADDPQRAGRRRSRCVGATAHVVRNFLAAHAARFHIVTHACSRFRREDKHQSDHFRKHVGFHACSLQLHLRGTGDMIS